MNEFEEDVEGDALLSKLNVDFLDVIDQTSKKHELNAEADLFTSSLSIRDTFPDFPYSSPYPQQIALMKAVYSAVENGNSGLFESPTGTGKSLSLLTASLRWLLDRNTLDLAYLGHLKGQVSELNTSMKKDEVDWISAYERNRTSKRLLDSQIENLVHMESSLELIEKLKSSFTDQTRQLVNACCEKLGVRSTEGETSLALKRMDMNEPHVPKEDDELFCVDTDVPVGPEECGELADTSPCENTHQFHQIIYCSRTHSQLAQLLGELAKSPSLSSRITTLQLSSRQTLCTYHPVYNLPTSEHINEACLDLVRSKKGCPVRCASVIKRLSNYLLSGGSASKIASAVRDNRLSAIFDKRYSSDLENKPRNLLAARIGCPYYAVRQGLPLAQLVLVPYATLLQPATRAASGLCLKNAVVIIDEAHNLLEATTSAMSVLLTLRDVRLVLQTLRAYLSNYRARFSAISSLRLRQLIYFVQHLLGLLEKPPSRSENSRLLSVGELLTEAGVDNVSIHLLSDYLDQKKFVMKIAGFARWIAEKGIPSSCQQESFMNTTPVGMDALLHGMKRRKEEKPLREDVKNPLQEKNEKKELIDAACGSKNAEDLRAAGGSLFRFHAFVRALVTSEEDTRIVVTSAKLTNKDAIKEDLTSELSPIESKVPSLYLTVLNPGRYLQDLVKESRCVLLAGGTMKPFDELIDQVFVPAGKSRQDIVTFSCNHVIDPKRQLAVFPVCNTAKGTPLDFTFQQRSQPSVMEACGEVVFNVCLSTPAGVVVFLPSYEYQSTICSHWEKTGMMDKLARVKRVFREPKSAVTLKQVMEAYSRAASDKRTGALLICVIGGKLSEGINFSDDLARSVIIVGMPYANPHCPLLREKMAYLDRHFRRPGEAPAPGREYYEGMCMRSINQTIGRAIRNANDYAAVFLVDRRFGRPSVQQKLPSWVLQGIQRKPDAEPHHMSISEAVKLATAFFTNLRQQQP